MKRKRANYGDGGERPTIGGLGRDASSIVFGYLTLYTPITRLVCKQWSLLDTPRCDRSVTRGLRISTWKLACELVEAGNTGCLGWILSKYEMEHDLYYPAVRLGRVQVLEFFERIGYPRKERLSPEQYCACAAGCGHLDVLKHLREQGYSWNEETFEAAVGGGHREITGWLKQNGCPWDAGAVRAAAHVGNTEFLMWARRNGHPWDGSVFTSAVSTGRPELLQWLKGNGCPAGRFADVAASGKGHVAVLQWLKDNGYAVNKDACLRRASVAGQTRVIEWLRDNIV